MTEAPIKGGEPEQPTQQATRTKRVVEAKRMPKDHERAKYAEELLRGVRSGSPARGSLLTTINGSDSIVTSSK